MTDHGPDYAATMAGATLLWRSLKSRQRSTLLGADACAGGYSIAARDEALAQSLHDRGLTRTPSRWARLTPVGVLVMHVGMMDAHE